MTNRNILNEADHLLVKHGVSELPLTMRKAEIIAQFSGWLLLTYDEGKELIEACGAEETAERYPAFTLIHRKQNVILFRASLSYEHKLFCILHEFGHIVLKHTAEKNVLGVTPSPEETARQEREADDFAAEMLAPSCVMYALGIRSAHQLERFGLTAEQALRHCDNIREPETEIEKALCERLPAVNYRKRTKRVNIVAVSIILSAFAALGMLMIYAFAGKGNTSSASSATNESPTVTIEAPAVTTTSGAETSTPSSSAVVVTSPQTTTTSKPEDEPQSETVYITKSGKRYHKADCRHIIGRDVIEKTIAEAEEDGYTPCKDCF